MKVPRSKVHCVGEITPWGKQLLKDLQAANVIEPTFQTTPEFISGNGPALVLVENTPDSRNCVNKLRANGRPFYFIWYGRGFSKEDFQFAVETRAYAVLEHARAEDPRVVEIFGKASESLEGTTQFEHLVHSLKSLLIQAEAESGSKALVTEVKTAVGKIEACILRNELLGNATLPTGDGATPFHRTQDFSDALQTVRDLERTGALFVKGDLPGNDGKVEFIQGKIVSAQAGDARGLTAIYRMFLWDTPKFQFSRKDPQDCFVEEPITMSLQHLSKEGEDLRQRFERIRREIPPAELKVELEPSALHAGTRLPVMDFSTLASVVEFGKVSQVIDNNPLPDVTLYESLIRLKKGNMLRVKAG